MSKSRSRKPRPKKRRQQRKGSNASRASLPTSRKPRSRLLVISLITGTVIAAAFGARLLSLPGEPRIEPPVHAAHADMHFTDVATQSREFMAFNRRIELTSEQEAIKRDALTRLRAACCSDYSAYTCCCECNLSRTVWGLAKHLIADQNLDAPQVAAAVTQWLDFVNPAGFGGNACFEGGCGRTFAHDGCGGMQEAHLAL